jgi:hypothetical protein
MTSEEYEALLLEKVGKHGWFIPCVFSDDDEAEPPFSYSVGFWEALGSPEVIVVGLPGQLAMQMINLLGAMIKLGQVSLHDGAVIDHLLDGYSCVARRVDSSWIGREHFNSALWYHELRTGKPLKDIYQIVWPSVGEGLFPWDEGCPTDVIEMQTALYLPKVGA